MLDIEVVASACSGAKQVIYFSAFTEQGWIDGLDAAVHDTVCKPSVASVSWGLAEGEDIWTSQAMAAINDTLKAAAALGMPVCIASGDDGSDDQVGDGRAHVNFPAASPYVLCVGGTMLPRKGTTLTEATWKEGDGLRKDRGGATGGGVSTVLARPVWQNVHIASVNPGAIDGRVVPDVSANAAGSTGYFTVVGGRLQVSGGTSAATPLWAALIARINVARAAAAKGKVGYLTPLLYQANNNTSSQPLGAVACKDIAQSDNVPAWRVAITPGSFSTPLPAGAAHRGTSLLNCCHDLAQLLGRGLRTTDWTRSMRVEDRKNASPPRDALSLSGEHRSFALAGMDLNH
jgi:kumamolisin